MFPKKIIIAGGGTAGWISASLLQHSWPESEIVLIESENIGTIGVGEGSTPGLRRFFKTLNISEQEWMPHCNATYKSGIEFANWSEILGYESYFHPFFSSLDLETGNLFFKLANEQKCGIPNNAHPDHFFVSKQIANQHKSPISINTPNFNLDYGYHFDAGLLAQFLKKRCLDLGLLHIGDDISDVITGKTGCVEGLVTDKNGIQYADLYVDCTGFRALIIQQTLKNKFSSYSDNLFNDRAVAIQTPKPIQSPIKTMTKSTALSNGWAWEIPLTNRYGNGYVYSSSFISPEQAEQELRAHLNLGESDVNVKHLTMKVGCISEHWSKNCLAVGLSQGFIEPLEATALMLVQYTLEKFIGQYTINEQEQIQRQTQYNKQINMTFEGVRDYIVTHYKTNSKSGSDYWQQCRENTNISTNLSSLLTAWNNSDPEIFEDELERQGNNHLVYLRPSWFVILAGMGQFPQQAIIKNNEINYHEKALKYCTEIASKIFHDHREYLNSFR
jgi:hypothetical protein